MRNRLAVVILFLSWPVEIIHRYWNNAPAKNVSWIIFDKTVNQDYRWYYCQFEMLLSMSFTLASLLIIKNKTRTFNIVLWASFLVSIIDIANYWLWFRRNEFLIFLEGWVMLSSIIIIFVHESKSDNEKAS